MIIYKITNTKNGKIYIGKSTTDINTRWKLHLKHAFVDYRKTRFCNALRKHGSNAFIKETIEDDIHNNDDLNEQEIFHITEVGSIDPSIGYNMSSGGDGGFTEEMRRRSSEVRKRKGITPKHKQALLDGRKQAGYTPKTKEQKQRISDGVKQYYRDHPEHLERITKINRNKAVSGTDHPMWTMSHTKEARAKISKARAGKTYIDIYGKSKANEIKERLQQQKTGNKNPNYSHIDVDLLIALTDEPRITRQSLCKLLDCSGPTLTKRFQQILGIENLQKFRYNKSDEELKVFFEDKLNDFLHYN